MGTIAEITHYGINQEKNGKCINTDTNDQCSRHISSSLFMAEV
jgi:hypothetical protein